MKNILKIFLNDMHKITCNPFALIILIGIMIIPSLYAWFNIYACWDPYSSTSGIKVAVSNNDQGYTLDGVNLNVGATIIDNLAQNHDMGWTFVDDSAAIEGVKSGRYYAAVIIPADFSEKIGSVTTLHITKPQIQYYVNEKKNAIAPKITGKGVDIVQQQVNESFVKTVTESLMTMLDETEQKVLGEDDMSVSSIAGRLKEVDQGMEELQVSVQAIMKAADSMENLIAATSHTLPDVNQSVNSAGELNNSVKGMLDSSKATSDQILGSVSTILKTSDETYANIHEITCESLSGLKKNAKDTANTLRDTKRLIEESYEIHKQLIIDLKKLNETLNQPELARLIIKLEEFNQYESNLMALLSETASTIEKTGSTAETVDAQINGQVLAARATLDTINSLYYSETSPGLETMVNSMYAQIESLSGLLTALLGTSPDMKASLNDLSDATADSKASLESLNTLIDDSRKELQKLIDEIELADSDEQIQEIVSAVQNSPSATADFMAEPVEVQTTNYYEVENYGSAMAPFYTTLCLWVGAIVLVAIMKCSIEKKGMYKAMRAHELFFGRYLLFVFAAVVQALIVCIGDLIFLKIQCHNPVLFVLAGIIASIVFSLFIYTLTISFGDVGKAVAVILLVIQVAGAGGTFPVEVLPAFFRLCNPLMPFTFGINAMRETVAGMYGLDYYCDLLKLCIYIPVSLIIGLVLRKPLIRLKEYCEGRLEETGIM